MTSSQPGNIVGWARVLPSYWPPLSRNLRHGAWYPIVNNHREDRVELYLYGKQVQVPRRLLDIRPQRPNHFSIVYRVNYEPDPSRKSADLGKRYVVCPICAQRSALWGKPDKRTCESCGHSGDVGWWE